MRVLREALKAALPMTLCDQLLGRKFRRPLKHGHPSSV